MENYNIIKKLGQGAFGITYLVEDKEYNKYVLKTIPMEKIDFAEFYQERNMLQKISNKGCQKGLLCYQNSFIDYNKNTINIITDYFNGISLGNFIGEYKMDKIYPSSEVVIQIMKNILYSLTLLHKLNMAHGDIKPENILINPKTLETQIIDFGTSCYKKCIPSGTLLYSSKEKLKLIGSTKKISVKKMQKDDVFGIGLVFYYLTHLEFPYIIKKRKSIVLPISINSSINNSVNLPESKLNSFTRQYSPEIMTDNNLLAINTLLDFYTKREGSIFSSYGNLSDDKTKIINDIIEEALLPEKNRLSVKRLYNKIKNI